MRKIKLFEKDWYNTYENTVVCYIDDADGLMESIETFEKITDIIIKEFGYWDCKLHYKMESKNKMIKPSEIILFEGMFNPDEIKVDMEQIRRNWKCLRSFRLFS